MSIPPPIPTHHFPEYYSNTLSSMIGQALAISSFTILDEMYQFFQGLIELVESKSLQRKLAIEWISRLLMFFTEETYLYYQKNGYNLGIIATGHVLNLCNRICAHFLEDSIFVMNIAAMRANMQFKIADALEDPTFETLEDFFSSVDFWFRMHNFKIRHEDAHLVPQFIMEMNETHEDRQMAQMVINNPIQFILPLTEIICRESEISTLYELAQLLEKVFLFFADHYVDKRQNIDQPIFLSVPGIEDTPMKLLCNRLHSVFVKMNRLLRLHAGHIIVFRENRLYLVKPRDQVDAERLRLSSRNAIKRLAIPGRPRQRRARKVTDEKCESVLQPVSSLADRPAHPSLLSESVSSLVCRSAHPSLLSESVSSLACRPAHPSLLSESVSSLACRPAHPSLLAEPVSSLACRPAHPSLLSEPVSPLIDELVDNQPAHPSMADDINEIEAILSSPEMKQILVDIVLGESLPSTDIVDGIDGESRSDDFHLHLEESVIDPYWTDGYEELTLHEPSPILHGFNDVFFDFANW